MGAAASVQPSDYSAFAAVKSSSTAPLPFPKDGVKLSFVNEFYGFCGGREKLEGLSTTDVCEKFIKPATKMLEVSFCDLLKSAKHPAVGVGQVFISHAWKYKFLDVVDALQFHFADTPDIIIWFDLYSNNQHGTGDRGFDWWQNTFKSAIQDFGHTVMVSSKTIFAQLAM